MSITTHVVKWDEAVKAAKADNLSDYLFPDDESERPEGDINLEDFTGSDSSNVFSAIAWAYGAMREKLPSDEKAQYDSWFWKIFGPVAIDGKEWYADDPELFKDDAFQSSFSPETVSELAQLGKAIPFEKMRDLFDQQCPEEEKGMLGEYSTDPADPFEGCFLPYLRGWVEFLERLESEELGVLFYTG